MEVLLMRFSYMVTSLSVGTESTVEHDDPARITMAVAASRIFYIMRDCFVYYRDIECSGKRTTHLRRYACQQSSRCLT